VSCGKYRIIALLTIAVIGIAAGATDLIQQRDAHIYQRLDRLSASVGGLVAFTSRPDASATALSKQLDAIQQEIESVWMPDLQGAAVPVSVQPGVNGPIAPVSMTRIGPGQFLIANYQNIYLFDEARRTAKRLTLEGSVPIWNPTAVFYSAFYDQVFIANYTGVDVIVAKLERNGDETSLKLVDRITDNEGIKGPQGIAISPGGRFMALADYVGNQVSLFERNDGVWAFRWKQPLTAAHGIAIIGNNVYAGGTVIAKFNIETGEEVARSTTIGDQPVLFATCLSEDHETGDLIGSDTMAGRVFLMTPDLKLKTSFGANGPGYNNLSMPYCAYRAGDSAYVLSTYQGRVVKLDKAGTISFELEDHGWKYLAETRNKAAMWHGATKFDSPVFRMFGKKVLPSYGSLHATDDTTLLLPARMGGDHNPWPFYVTTIAQNGDWLAVVANSSPVAILYNRKTGMLGSARLDEWDCWAAAADVLCPSRKRSTDDLAGKMKPLEDEPAPADAPKYLADSVGTAVPIIDYWRAWRKAGSDSN